MTMTKTQLHSYLQHRLQCTTPQYPCTTMLSTNIPYAMYSGVLLKLLVDVGMLTKWKNNGGRVQFSCLSNNKDQLHGEEADTFLHAGAPPRLLPHVALTNEVVSFLCNTTPARIQKRDPRNKKKRMQEVHWVSRRWYDHKLWLILKHI